MPEGLSGNVGLLAGPGWDRGGTVMRQRCPRRYLLDWPRARVIASIGEVAAERTTNQHFRQSPDAGPGTQAPKEVP